MEYLAQICFTIRFICLVYIGMFLLAVMMSTNEQLKERLNNINTGAFVFCLLALIFVPSSDVLL